MRDLEDGDADRCINRGYHEWRVQKNNPRLPDRCISCGKVETFSYPEQTLYSPRGTTTDRAGKVVKVGGTAKFKATEPKPLPPLKHDTLSGYGEKRKRYVR